MSALTTRRTALLLAAALFTATFAGCGHKGDPLPPVRFQPVVTSDLVINQQGDALVIRLRYPQTTASGGALPGLEAVEVWDLATPLPVESAMALDERVFAGSAKLLVTLDGAELRSATVGDRIETRIPLPAPPAEDSSANTHVLAVKTRSTTAETSLFSNRVTLPIEPPLAPPAALEVEARADGIELRWQPPALPEGRSAAGFNVYRRLARERGWGVALAPVGPDATSYLDDDASFAERYIYTVRTVAQREPLIEGGDAAEIEIDYRDRFAPDPPAALVALSEAGQVRLLITPSPSADTVGYHLYRRDPGQAATFRRLTEQPITRLEYIDRGLTAGLTFTYRASAVDGVGNEGEPGDEVATTLPP